MYLFCSNDRKNSHNNNRILSKIAETFKTTQSQRNWPKTSKSKRFILVPIVLGIHTIGIGCLVTPTKKLNNLCIAFLRAYLFSNHFKDLNIFYCRECKYCIQYVLEVEDYVLYIISLWSQLLNIMILFF